MCNQREYLNGSSQIDLVLCVQMFDNSKERGSTAFPLLINFIIRQKLRDFKKNLINHKISISTYLIKSLSFHKVAVNAVPELSA